jgi:hypothetical protein
MNFEIMIERLKALVRDQAVLQLPTLPTLASRHIMATE